jgi:hypothetical protein
VRCSRRHGREVPGKLGAARDSKSRFETPLGDSRSFVAMSYIANSACSLDQAARLTRHVMYFTLPLDASASQKDHNLGLQAHVHGEVLSRLCHVRQQGGALVLNNARSTADRPKLAANTAARGPRHVELDVGATGHSGRGTKGLSSRVCGAPVRPKCRGRARPGGRLQCHAERRRHGVGVPDRVF